MDKRDLKEAALDRPSKYQIVLSKYKSEDDEYDMGWECDVWVDNWCVGGGTAPTKAGIYDLANEIIYDYENPRDF